MTNGSQSPLVALTEEIGEHQLNVLIMQFSESIVEDADLEVAFKGMDAEALSEHMTNLIKMSLDTLARPAWSTPTSVARLS